MSRDREDSDRESRYRNSSDRESRDCREGRDNKSQSLQRGHEGSDQGVTKRCRLSWLINCDPRKWAQIRGGGDLRGLIQWVQLYTEAQINFGDLTPYLTYGSDKDRDWGTETQGRNRAWNIKSAETNKVTEAMFMPTLLLGQWWKLGGEVDKLRPLPRL